MSTYFLFLYCLNIFQQLLHVFKSYLNRTLKIISILLKTVHRSKIHISVASSLDPLQ